MIYIILINLQKLLIMVIFTEAVDGLEDHLIKQCMVGVGVLIVLEKIGYYYTQVHMD